MRNTTDFTRGYQFGYMLKREMIAIIICALVEFTLFMGSYSNDSFRNVSGVLFSVANFLVIYDSAAALGKLDLKTYTPLEFDIKWSVLWGIFIGVINLVWIAVFYLNWHLGAVDGTLSNPISVAVNIIFYIWQAPYLAFLGMSPKTIPVAVIILGFVLPVLASVTGYISSKKMPYFSDKIRNMMFEKENKDT